MNPFYFGTRERRLFGIYHPATGRPVRSTGIVLCPPMFLESMRIHRVLRQLSGELAELGFHVLRFDYHGTGDSGGTGEQETLDGWTEDVRSAVRELSDLTAVTRTTLVGVRFGAVIAARAAPTVGALEDLVLWDPIPSGRGYLRWMLQRCGLDDVTGGAAPDDLVEAPADEGEVVGLDGFPVSRRLLREMGTEDLDRLSIRNLAIRRVVVAASPETDHEFLLHRLYQDGVPTAAKLLPEDAAWEDPQRQGTMVFAPRTIQEIVDCLTSAPN